MSTSLILARKHKPIGIYTAIKKLWRGLQTLEECDVLGKHLVLVDRHPDAKEETLALTYTRLCRELSHFGRADIRDERDPEPLPIKYAIWEMETNIIHDDLG